MARRLLRSAGSCFLLILFAAGVTTPGVVMLANAGAHEATTENRLLASMPAWSWDWAAIQEYPAAFEKYFNDSFGLRQTLTRWHHLTALRVFGMSPHPSVVVGKDDGWLYLDVSISDYRGDRHFTEQDLALRTKLLQQRHDWLAAQGIKYLVVFVPNKPTIYPEHVPAHVRPQHEKDNMRLLEEYAAEHGTFAVLNLTDCLAEASRTKSTYPASDCHWNDYGAYVAYVAMIEKLRVWFPELTPLTPEQLAVKDIYRGGDLGFLAGLPEEFIEPRTLLSPAVPRSVLVERTHAPLSYYSETSTVDDPRLPRAVVFHDSFMTNQRIFVSENFSLTRYLRVENRFDPQTVVEYRPQVVIQEVVERMLPGLVVNPPELNSLPSGPTTPSPPLAAGPTPTQVR